MDINMVKYLSTKYLNTNQEFIQHFNKQYLQTVGHDETVDQIFRKGALKVNFNHYIALLKLKVHHKIDQDYAQTIYKFTFLQDFMYFGA